MEKTDQILGKTHTMGIFEQFAEIKEEEGLQKGIRRGLKKAARGLLINTDFTVEKISELIGLPVSVVRSVKKQLDRK